MDGSQAIRRSRSRPLADSVRSRVDTDRVRASVLGMNEYKVSFWINDEFATKNVTSDSAREAVTSIISLYGAMQDPVMIDSVAFVLDLAPEFWA
jgi:hypothetical protein